MVNISQEQDIENYYLLKGRFKGNDSNTFGLFIMSFSLTQKSIDNVLVAASHFSGIYETSTQTLWNEFEDKITQLKWKGEISVNTSHDLQLLLSNSIRQDIAEELIEAMANKQMNKVEHTLTNILIRGLLDKMVSLELNFDKISHKDIIKIKDERARKEKEVKEELKKEAIRQAETEKFKVEEGAVTLPVNLVLAPVSGIPVFEIKNGDMIMVKIDGATERGNYFIDLLNARTPEGEIMPVKGTVKGISMNALGEFELMVEIGPGIYGKSLEAEQVKIKKYDIREEKIRVDDKESKEQISSLPGTQSILEQKNVDNRSKDFFIWLIGGITFLLAILILYLLFSGIL